MQKIIFQIARVGSKTIQKALSLSDSAIESVTVGDLKKLLCEKFQLPYDGTVLSVGGAPLEDDWKGDDFGLMDGTVIMVNAPSNNQSNPGDGSGQGSATTQPAIDPPHDPYAAENDYGGDSRAKDDDADIPPPQQETPTESTAPTDDVPPPPSALERPSSHERKSSADQDKSSQTIKFSMREGMRNIGSSFKPKATLPAAGSTPRSAPSLRGLSLQQLLALRQGGGLASLAPQSPREPPKPKISVKIKKVHPPTLPRKIWLERRITLRRSFLHAAKGSPKQVELHHLYPGLSVDRGLMEAFSESLVLQSVGHLKLYWHECLKQLQAFEFRQKQVLLLNNSKSSTMSSLMSDIGLVTESERDSLLSLGLVPAGFDWNSFVEEPTTINLRVQIEMPFDDVSSSSADVSGGVSEGSSKSSSSSSSGGAAPNIYEMYLTTADDVRAKTFEFLTVHKLDASLAEDLEKDMREVVNKIAVDESNRLRSDVERLVRGLSLLEQILGESEETASIVEDSGMSLIGRATTTTTRGGSTASRPEGRERSFSSTNTKSPNSVKSDSAPPDVFSGNADEEFNAADTDGDGNISKSEWRKWMDEKQAMVEAHNKDRLGLIRENRRLRQAMDPKTENVDTRLRNNEDEKTRLIQELASAQSMSNKIQVELNSTLKQLEESERTRETNLRENSIIMHELQQEISELGIKLMQVQGQLNEALLANEALRLQIEDEQKRMELLSERQIQQDRLQGTLQNLSSKGFMIPMQSSMMMREDMTVNAAAASLSSPSALNNQQTMVSNHAHVMESPGEFRTEYFDGVDHDREDEMGESTSNNRSIRQVPASTGRTPTEYLASSQGGLPGEARSASPDRRRGDSVKERIMKQKEIDAAGKRGSLWR